MNITICFIVLVLFLFPPFAASSVSAPKMFLQEGSLPQERLLLDRISVAKNQRLAEKQKINFLLNRVKESPYLFIRNGTKHSGVEARSHLRWKYGFVQSRIQTTEEFIDTIASKSLATGEKYYIRIGGKDYPVGDIFYNELNRLNEIVQTQPAGS